MTGSADLIRLPGSRPDLRPEIVAAWCDDIARRTRAGESLRSALHAATTDDAALHQSTEPIRHALDRGATIPQALDRVAGPSATGGRRRPVVGLDHLALACSVIAVVATIGGAPSSPLDRVAAALRLRAVDRDDRATQTAQARMSAHVLTIVPLLMLALLIIVDDDVRHAVVAPAGATCVVVGLVLNMLGWSWMRHIVGVPR